MDLIDLNDELRISFEMARIRSFFICLFLPLRITVRPFFNIFLIRFLMVENLLVCGVDSQFGKLS